jgi:monoamine oxidase
MAASCLSAANYGVTVIEARNRIGGRIHTTTDYFSSHVEMGAEFIHGDQPVTMSLVKESKNSVSILEGKWCQLRNGALSHADLFDDQWDLVIKKLKHLKADTSMASFLEQNFGGEQYAGLREKVKGFVEGYDAADMNRVSALALREEWSESGNDDQHHIKGGYQKLIHYLHDKIKANGSSVRLNSPVVEIKWSAGHVVVATESGEQLKGDKVIVTVPLGVLHRRSIRFSPSLKIYEEAFDRMGFGGVIKFLFEFNEPFWQTLNKQRLKDLAFILSDAEIPTWWTQRPEKTPLLTGWLGGPTTYDVSHDREVLFQKAMASLPYILDCSKTDIQSAITHWDIADWVADPYAFGAYAYPTVEGKNARSTVSEPVHNTIFFAGEAIYEGAAMGTVEAAFVSGQEVARKIVSTTPVPPAGETAPP